MNSSTQVLEALRARIDQVDSALLDLLNSRAEIVIEVQDLKRELGLPSYSAARESAIVERLKSANSGPLPDEAVEDIFFKILQHSISSLGPWPQMNKIHKCTADSKILRVGNVKIGGSERVLMCGPCAVESEDQIERTASFLSRLHIPIMRGGAFKPRTSPYSFQGLGQEGLSMLVNAAKRHGLLIVSEIIDVRDIDLFVESVDILQIGARNMQNSPLLREAGQSDKPVLLKRGFRSTVEEMLLAAEYILLEGNQRVILCERGIRTFEPLTRNTLDLACVALVKRMTSLPIVVDLSHSLGRTDIMTPMAKAALACGSDGLMIEVHPNPIKALSDGKQSLSFEDLAVLKSEIQPMLHSDRRKE